MPSPATRHPPMTETIDSAKAAASTLFLGQNGEFWDFWLVASVVLAAIAAIAIGITTTGSVVSHKREASASEEALERYKIGAAGEVAKAHERIAELSTQGEALKKGAAEAEARTKQAELQLEQMRFPRRLNSEKLKDSLKEVAPQFFEVWYDQSTADGSGLAFEIFVTLASIGWTTDQKLPAPLTPQWGPPDLRDVYQLLTLTQQYGASPWGVSVVTKGPISDDEKRPERMLGNALLTSVASPVQMVGGGKDETMPAGKIRIVVSPKLP